jgi:hypothetical protein
MRYTVAATGRAQQRLAEELRHLDSPATHPGAVVIVWSAGADPINGVVAHIVDGNDGVIELILDDSGTYSTFPMGTQPPVTELLQRVRHRRQRLVARLDAQTTLPIVGYRAQEFENPNFQHPIFLHTAGQVSRR